MRSFTLLKVILVCIFFIGFTSNVSAGPMDDLFLNGFINNDSTMINKAVSNGANNPNYTRGDMTPLIAAINNKNSGFVEWLIKNGADINLKESSFPKRTPLIRAASVNDPKIIQLLVNAGANINDTDGNGKTALYFALNNNNLPAAEFLISKGADVNYVNVSGETLLMCVSDRYLFPGDRNVKITIAKTLLKAGADPKAVNPKNMKTALQIAIDTDFTEMIDLFLPISPK